MGLHGPELNVSLQVFRVLLTEFCMHHRGAFASVLLMVSAIQTILRDI